MIINQTLNILVIIPILSLEIIRILSSRAAFQTGNIELYKKKIQKLCSRYEAKLDNKNFTFAQWSVAAW